MDADEDEDPGGKGGGGAAEGSGFSIIFSMMKLWTCVIPSTVPVIRHTRSCVPDEKREREGGGGGEAMVLRDTFQHYRSGVPGE